MRGHVKDYFVQDSDGRWRTNYYGNVLTGNGTRGGESGKPWRGFDPTAKGRHWAIPGALVEEVDEDLSELTQHQKLDRLYELGYITIEKNAAWPMYEHYVRADGGTPAPDIWAFQPYTEGTVFGTEAGIDADVRWLAPKDAERLGYPTQKPEALLGRIIEASSDPGDVVLDPFCGCGTTVAVAERLKRRWIGIDISPTAMEIMRRRLWNQSRCVPTIVDLPDTEDALRLLKPFEFQNYIINALNGTHSPKKSGDMGIDGFWFFTKDPIQVKQSQHPVGRNVVDNFETAMRRGKYDVGYIVAFTFTRDAVEEVARAKNDGLNIKLVRVKEVLMQVKRPGNTLAKFGPQPEGDVIPLPAIRKKKDLPTPEELIRSAHAEAAGA